MEHLGRVTACPKCRLSIITEADISSSFHLPGSGKGEGPYGGLKNMNESEKKEEIEEISWDDLDGLGGGRYDKLPEGKTVIVFAEIKKIAKVETKFGERILVQTKDKEFMLPVYVAQEIKKVKANKDNKQVVIRRQGKDKDTKYFVSED